MKINNIAFYLALSAFCGGIAETSLSLNEQANTKFCNGIQYAYDGNYSEAFKLFQELIHEGHIGTGLAGIGRAHYLQSDYNKAFEFYQRSADKDNPIGQFLLGDMYELGIGEVKEDLEKAFELYSLSSQQGYHHAKYRLGLMYEYGSYVNQNLDKALRLYAEAWVIDENFEEAKMAMRRVASYGDKFYGFK